MSPELYLLRELLGYISAPSTGKPFLPDPKVDWEVFGRLTQEHRLAPLFRYKLQDTPWRRSLPPSLWSVWEGEYHFQLRETVLNQERFRRLLEIFRDKGIEPVVIKGVHLAEVYYPSPVLRPMDDIDILIRKEDQGEVRQALAQEGWRIWEEAPGGHKAVFLNRDRGPRLFLEIHTDLQSPGRRDPSFSIEVADFHRAVRPGKLYGVEALVLEPTSNLLYLSYHNTHHDLFRLIWFYDLHLLIEKSGSEIDWKRLLERAKTARSLTHTYYALLITKDLFGSAVPEDFLREASPPAWKRALVRPFLNPKQVLRGKAAIPLLQRLLLNDKWSLGAWRYLFSGEND